MPLNLLQHYNALLDIDALEEPERIDSLMGIFKRDFVEHTNRFRQKIILPTLQDGKLTLKTLFEHLITTAENKSLHRVYDPERARRLHWIRFHLAEKNSQTLYVFSVQDKKAIRTYLYDYWESYVIVLEPRGKNRYYLLTAYYVKGRNRNKIWKMWCRKLSSVY